MTYSICAIDGDNHGAAVATCGLVVGSTVPQVDRHGVVCTQATTSTPLGVRVIRSLADGVSVDSAVERFLAADPNAARRQIHGLDRRGATVAHTGDECVPWHGHVVGDGYTIAGNILAGKSVLAAIENAYFDTTDRPLDERLLAALRAGERAGGDDRGSVESAALSVYEPSDPGLHHDLRVDRSDDAVAELTALHEGARAADDRLRAEFPGMDFQRHPEGGNPPGTSLDSGD